MFREAGEDVTTRTEQEDSPVHAGGRRGGVECWGAEIGLEAVEHRARSKQAEAQGRKEQAGWTAANASLEPLNKKRYRRVK